MKIKSLKIIDHDVMCYIFLNLYNIIINNLTTFYAHRVFNKNIVI